MINYPKICCINCSKVISSNCWKRHDSTCKGIHVKRKRVAWNKNLSKETDDRVAQNGLSNSASKGKRAPMSDVGKANISAGVKGKSGGFRENAGRSRKFHVLDSYGKTTCLQSSYELLCSKILDELEIKWSRPSYFKYGKRKYYPDFLLNDFEIYLDTKNDYLAKIDEKKIQAVIDENSIKLLVLTIDKITKEFISKLV